MMHASFSTRLGKVITVEDTKNPAKLVELVQKYQVVVLRGQNLSINEQLELTQKFNEVEHAWEDVHPKCRYIQLMDSTQQKMINIKSSSKYWHLDRSFMPRQTRYTILHAVKIGLGARGTQFIDSRRLYESLPQKRKNQFKELFAEHDFALRFPKIMEAKGVSKQHIMSLIEKYPPSVHPLVQRTTFGESLYFSELCVGRIHGVSEKESNDLINLLNSLLSETTEIYDHVWQPTDTLIWDNFSTIHRANPHASQGLRILHRSTAS